MNTLRRAAGAAILVAAVGAIGGCTSEIEGTAVAATGTPGSTSITTTVPLPTTGTSSASTDLSIDVSVGECVTLGGTEFDATVDNAECGSSASNYKVIDIVDRSESCPGDADQTYYETYAGLEVGALCLDVDWVVGDCIDFGGEDPQRIVCSEPAVQGEKVTEILQGTSDVNDCSISEGGFVYRERNFVVCTDTI